MPEVKQMWQSDREKRETHVLQSHHKCVPEVLHSDRSLLKSSQWYGKPKRDTKRSRYPTVTLSIQILTNRYRTNLHRWWCWPCDLSSSAAFGLFVHQWWNFEHDYFQIWENDMWDDLKHVFIRGNKFEYIRCSIILLHYFLKGFNTRNKTGLVD